jgi:hypothetical protein
MTIREFIKYMSIIKDELQDTEIVIKADNGLLMQPIIKFIAIDEVAPYIMTKENVKRAIIEY